MNAYSVHLGLVCALVAGLVSIAPVDTARAEDGNELPEFELATKIDTEADSKIDRVLVLKSKRRLLLQSRGTTLAEYRIALGGQPVGPKQRRGDRRTPEGYYFIDWRKRNSDYYRALHISYPNFGDRLRSRARAVDPGGSIMIHGLPNGYDDVGPSHVLADWTDGCIAVTNREMDEIWERVEDGVPIEIRP